MNTNKLVFHFSVYERLGTIGTTRIFIVRMPVFSLSVTDFIILFLLAIRSAANKIKFNIVSLYIGRRNLCNSPVAINVLSNVNKTPQNISLCTETLQCVLFFNAFCIQLFVPQLCFLLTRFSATSSFHVVLDLSWCLFPCVLHSQTVFGD